MRRVFLVFILLVTSMSCSPLKSGMSEDTSNLDVTRGFYRIMFYNVENLFDTYDDPLKRDEEFLPTGLKYWTKSRYYQKLNHIYQVIMAVGGWETPEVIGLCEVENRLVLEQLIDFTPLSKFKYRIIHKESADNRGVDVALLYRKDKFLPILYEAIPIKSTSGKLVATRDILYVKGTTYKKDTLHIYVNHWPSRWGGQLESEARRMLVASVLKSHVDSVLNADSKSNVLIMGDMNDYPSNKSILDVLGAQLDITSYKDDSLYNLAYYLKEHTKLGTHKQETWGVLDQMIVNGSMFNTNNRFYIRPDNMNIFYADYLLERDNANVGFKPFRTYIGYRFNGGYSDHLPVFLDLNDGIRE